MISKRARASIALVWVGAITLVLGGGGCGSGGGGASGDAGSDATTTSCTSDSECAASVPPTQPTDCATGKCNAVQGVCEYVAMDEDGDGHTAANCKSTTSVPVQAGDDCNDMDPDLYPGHPEPCTPVFDGGAADAGYCPQGLISCLSDGTESACSMSCSVCEHDSLGCDVLQPQQCNQSGTAWQNVGSPCSPTGTTPACLGGACVACNPGAVTCNGQQPQKCSATGSWQPSGAACVNQTCVSATGACTGVCAPSQTNPVPCGNCNPGTDTQTCSDNGTWQTSGTCVGQGCTPNSTQSCNNYGTQSCSASCAWGSCSCPLPSVCTPEAKQCTAEQPQTCDACGQWQNGGSVCGGATPFCTAGACTANPLSCTPGGSGMTTCGAGSESCCTSLEVTGGTYSRTYTNSGSGPTGTADPATVSGFRLDKYEVTVGRFRQFVSALTNGFVPSAGSGKHAHLNGGQGLNATGGGYEAGWSTADDTYISPTDSPIDANLALCAPYSTWTSGAGANEMLPISCVDWYEAQAFCIWDGGFLPSEAEWEYAAAGGSQQSEYPWGTAAPGTGNQYAIYGCLYPSGTASCTGVPNVAPVGTTTAGAGLWGQLDLAGNVLEWNLDWFATYVDPCLDCANLTPGADRVNRGGQVVQAATTLLPPSRDDGPPSYRNFAPGVRCARSP